MLKVLELKKKKETFSKISTVLKPSTEISPQKSCNRGEMRNAGSGECGEFNAESQE